MPLGGKCIGIHSIGASRHDNMVRGRVTKRKFYAKAWSTQAEFKRFYFIWWSLKSLWNSIIPNSIFVRVVVSERVPEVLPPESLRFFMCAISMTSAFCHWRMTSSFNSRFRCFLCFVAVGSLYYWIILAFICQFMSRTQAWLSIRVLRQGLVAPLIPIRPTLALSWTRWISKRKSIDINKN